MRGSFGSWTPKRDRVSGPIRHLAPYCMHCGVCFADVNAGRAEHDMAWHPSVYLSPLRFAAFDLDLAIDTAVPRALRSKHAT